MTSIDDTLASIDASLQSMAASLKIIATPLAGGAGGPAVSAKFIVPTHRSIGTGEAITMATPLLSDVISNIPLAFANAAGVAVPEPAGETNTVSIDNDLAGTVAMGADGKSVDFSPVQPPDLTQVATISFTGGSLPVATLAISLTSDEAAASASFAPAGITTRALGT